jgi:hypothetical protein
VGKLKVPLCKGRVRGVFIILIDGTLIDSEESGIGLENTGLVK